jgi:hypothetical protein
VEAEVNRDLATIFMVLNIGVIAGGVIVILMAMYQRGKAREMQHRERLAMIEKGLMPAPERDPAAFNGSQSTGRYSIATSIGVVIIALGVGLMLLIGVVADAPNAAVGVGGAIAVLGGAFVILGELQRRSRPRQPGV